ncbi:MAG: glycosyltransferase family 39 protein, partial [Phycisphaerales bacterium]|nr:glycosyltransferase family 39 protein [Phycisphaerales bacterium]
VDTFLRVFDEHLFTAPVGWLALWTLAFTIPTAALSYWIVERPSLRLKKRRLLPKRAQPVFERWFSRWGTFEWALLTIALAGMILRLAYIWFERRPHFEEFGVIGDAGFYHWGANVLADGLGFINPFQYYWRGLHVQEASHPPLYSLWLTIPSLLGFRGTTSHMLWTVPVGTATIVFAGLAAKEMLGKRVGIIAAFLVAFYPNVWSHDGFLTSETMSISTATLTIWMAYRYWRAPSMRRAIALGLALGLAVAARTEMTMLIPFMVIPLVLATRDTSWKERWKRLVAAGLMVLVIIGPWLVFNFTRFDRPVIVSTGFGITLMSANCDSTYYGDDIGYWSMPCTLAIDEKYGGLYKIDQSVAESTYRKEALDYIGNHKKRFAYVTLVRWARYTGIWDLTHGFDQVHKDITPEGREPWVAWTSVFAWFVVFPSAIVGAFLLHRRRVPVYIVAAPIIASFVTITMTFHQNRYRASAET